MWKSWHTIIGIILLTVIMVSGCGGIQAETGDTVKVHYTGTLTDGSVFDTSIEREPLEFTIGEGRLISSFEEAVNGMKVGESKTVNIPAEQAYGLHRDDFVFTVELSELPGDIEVGSQLDMNLASGNVIVVTVTSISETTATVDANHRLAGEDLIFEIELVEIE
jgi:FKBP-type peptidyl-prolyl cis-trans isomerase 2